MSETSDNALRRFARSHLSVGAVEDKDAEISRLSARVKELEDKLLPFAKAADCFPDREGIVMRLRVSDELDVKITWHDLHEAKRALNQPESDKEGS